MATALRSLDGSGRFACRPVLHLLLKPSRRSTRGDRTRTRHHANTMHGTRTDVTASASPVAVARRPGACRRYYNATTTSAVRPWPCARTPCVGCERSRGGSAPLIRSSHDSPFITRLRSRAVTHDTIHIAAIGSPMRDDRGRCIEHDTLATQSPRAATLTAGQPFGSH